MFGFFRRRPSGPGNVYYVRLKTKDGTFYKLGVTGKSTLFERFAWGGYGDEEMIDREFFFTYRQDAYQIEQHLLDHFHKDRVFAGWRQSASKPLYKRGQTELFARDVLGLDELLYQPLSTKEYEAARTSARDGGFGLLMIIGGLILLPFTVGFSLILILLGACAFWESATSGAPKLPRSRPVHPPEIEAIINALAGTPQERRQRDIQRAREALRLLDEAPAE